ncbi:YbaB/EbfC family nucleoid-associated protein [Candidatus Phytoplasma meliae]|uniref:YbaB/EbfC family nucleoid-associated protein n=1 Tax=Candidatus Phytoplasma meliae TaxID=1848402 RepID=A0ABS5CXJ6_9MOLU|nr:YbaB/EbfC family nucleoid-associated protein [Candidatus Phytoplasma meliae]MBP5835707.1 YbaB/EbfC family nucleoid-associated protein [Candidatus Phytoplasma meliae]
METKSNMLTKLQKMQEAIESAQRTLELQEFIGKAGDVIIVLQGTKQVIDVIIEKNNNTEVLQESILLAFNAALKKLEKTSKEIMGRVSVDLTEF